MLAFVVCVLLISKAVANCPSNSTEWNSNCYSFLNVSTGFADAELSCKQAGGQLASIHDGFTNAFLAQEGGKHFHESPETDFWIGATNLMKPPTWNWTDGSLFDFTDWTKGEPKNISGSNCAALSTIDGFWTSQDCFKSKPFACQLPTTPSYPTSANCSMGWYYIPQAHACYGSKGGRSHILNWTASQDYCESFGAQLPSINTLAEFQYLQSFIYTYWKNLWTGIFSVDGGKHWKNSDNTSADDFTKLGLWCSGRPITNISGERCATVYAGCIFDNDCSIGYDTICKKLL